MSILVIYRIASHRHPLIPSTSLVLRFSSTPDSKGPLVDYLIETFSFSRTKALSLSNRFHRHRNPERPQSVIRIFQSLGFSEAQIRASVASAPQILFRDVDKTLKPKLEFFQQLGLVGSKLGKFISKNPTLLTISLHRRIIPCTELIKSVLSKGNRVQEEDLIKVLRRCDWILYCKPVSGLLSNKAYLESCGIVGSQLSFLLKTRPFLLVMKESRLRELVSKVIDMGFTVNSRMLVYAICTVGCLRKETIRRKLDFLKSCGFSEQECKQMIRRAPGLLLTSENKLKLGIEFFTNTLKFNRSVLVCRPICLISSIEERAIPRYRVLQVLKSKRLLRKDPSFLVILNMTEDNFLNKFVSPFTDCAEELLVAYKGPLIDSSET